MTWHDTLVKALDSVRATLGLAQKDFKQLSGNVEQLPSNEYAVPVLPENDNILTKLPENNFLGFEDSNDLLPQPSSLNFYTAISPIRKDNRDIFLATNAPSGRLYQRS